MPCTFSNSIGQIWFFRGRRMWKARWRNLMKHWRWTLSHYHVRFSLSSHGSNSVLDMWSAAVVVNDSDSMSSGLVTFRATRHGRDLNCVLSLWGWNFSRLSLSLQSLQFIFLYSLLQIGRNLPRCYFASFCRSMAARSLLVLCGSVRFQDVLFSTFSEFSLNFIKIVLRKWRTLFLRARPFCWILCLNSIGKNVMWCGSGPNRAGLRREQSSSGVTWQSTLTTLKRQVCVIISYPFCRCGRSPTPVCFRHCPFVMSGLRLGVEALHHLCSCLFPCLLVFVIS